MGLAGCPDAVEYAQAKRPLMLNAQPAPMTATELNAAIAAGKFKVTRLPVRRPRKGEATMSRVGGAKTAWRPSNRVGHANRHIRSGAPA